MSAIDYRLPLTRQSMLVATTEREPSHALFDHQFPVRVPTLREDRAAPSLPPLVSPSSTSSSTSSSSTSSSLSKVHPSHCNGDQLSPDTCRSTIYPVKGNRAESSNHSAIAVTQHPSTPVFTSSSSSSSSAATMTLLKRQLQQPTLHEMNDTYFTGRDNNMGEFSSYKEKPETIHTKSRARVGRFHQTTISPTECTMSHPSPSPPSSSSHGDVTIYDVAKRETPNRREAASPEPPNQSENNSGISAIHQPIHAETNERDNDIPGHKPTRGHCPNLLPPSGRFDEVKDSLRASKLLDAISPSNRHKEIADSILKSASSLNPFQYNPTLSLSQSSFSNSFPPPHHHHHRHQLFSPIKIPSPPSSSPSPAAAPAVTSAAPSTTTSLRSTLIPHHLYSLQHSCLFPISFPTTPIIPTQPFIDMKGITSPNPRTFHPSPHSFPPPPHPTHRSQISPPSSHPPNQQDEHSLHSLLRKRRHSATHIPVDTSIPFITYLQNLTKTLQQSAHTKSGLSGRVRLDMDTSSSPEKYLPTEPDSSSTETHNCHIPSSSTSSTISPSSSSCSAYNNDNDMVKDETNGKSEDSRVARRHSGMIDSIDKDRDDVDNTNNGNNNDNNDDNDGSCHDAYREDEEDEDITVNIEDNNGDDDDNDDDNHNEEEAEDEEEEEEDKELTGSDEGSPRTETSTTMSSLKYRKFVRHRRRMSSLLVTAHHSDVGLTTDGQDTDRGPVLPLSAPLFPVAPNVHVNHPGTVYHHHYHSYHKPLHHQHHQHHQQHQQHPLAAHLHPHHSHHPLPHPLASLPVNMSPRTPPLGHSQMSSPSGPHFGHTNTSAAASLYTKLLPHPGTNPALSTRYPDLHPSFEAGRGPGAAAGGISSLHGRLSHFFPPSFLGLTSLGMRRPPADKPPPVKKYKCDVCHKAFSRSNTLVTHKRIHTGDKPFKCEICGRAFRQPGNLTRHRLTHTTHKPYVCHVCGKAFNRASNLNTHIRTHSSFRQFGCSVYSKAPPPLPLPPNDKHEANGDAALKCDVCGRCFAHSGMLLAHRRTHTHRAV